MARNHTKNEPLKAGDKAFIVYNNQICKVLIKEVNKEYTTLYMYILNDEPPKEHTVSTRTVFRTKRELIIDWVYNSNNFSKPQPDVK